MKEREHIHPKTHQHFSFDWQWRRFANSFSVSNFSFCPGRLLKAHFFSLIQSSAGLLSWPTHGRRWFYFKVHENTGVKKYYLDVFERVDFRLWRAKDVLRSCSSDLHQVQKPLPIFVPFRPLNVQRGLDRRRRRLPQVVYLKEKSVC